MISILKCTQILNKNGKKYTEEQIKTIREFLMFLAQIEYKFNKK
jgi:hypothetical protein